MTKSEIVILLIVILISLYIMFGGAIAFINKNVNSQSDSIIINNKLIELIDNRDSVLNFQIDSIKQEIKNDNNKLPEIKKIYVNEIKTINDSSIDYNINLFKRELSKTDSIK